MYPLKLKPIYDETIWANNKLTTMRHIDAHTFGTSWEVSAHPHAQSIVMNGNYQGKTLISLIEEKQKEMLGKIPFHRMLRLAFLDAKQDLSIQVHPNDAYAHTYEHDEGKVESWYILAADQDATLVAGTTNPHKEVIKQAVDEGHVEEYVRHIPVSEGDFVCIDAGMLHALGKGILALEIGQNSNTTYRFYDYNRKDKNGNLRELHIKKSFDVADFSYVCTPVHTGFHELTCNEEKMLVDRDEFSVKLVDICKSYQMQMDHERFYCLSNVKKDCILRYHGEDIAFQFTDNIFVPAACDDFEIVGDTRILVSYVR